MARPQASRSFGERRKRVAGARRPVVRPVWPLFAVMFGGVWLAWPWFLVNEWLLDSDELPRQAKVVAVGLLGSLILAALVMTLVGADILGVREARYAYVLLTAWKLGVSYRLESRQRPAFELWTYFGGNHVNGVYVVVVGVYLASLLFEALPFGLLWLVLR